MIGTATRCATVPGHIRMVTGFAATSELVSLLRQCVKSSARTSVTWNDCAVTGTAERVNGESETGPATLMVRCPALPVDAVAADELPEVRLLVQSQEISFTAQGWRIAEGEGAMLAIELPDHFQESHFRMHPRLRTRRDGLELHLVGRNVRMHVKDVSLGGLGVALATSDSSIFEVDRRYGPFHLMLPGEGGITFHAEVRYRLPRVTEGLTRMGLAIRKISPDHQARLRAFLATLEPGVENA